MSETAGRSVPNRPQPSGGMTPQRRRFRLSGVNVLFLLAGALVGYIFGRVVAYRDISEARALNQQVQTESQKLKAEINDQNARLTLLQAKLTSVQAALNAIVPSENTYNVTPNQSLIVAGGRLTIGLIGSPKNEGVNININGKPQLAAAGDVTKIALDPSTTCQVAVQSFDMFKAVVTASCAAATKPQ